MWKQIDGYFWPYRINEEAEVQRLAENGEWRPLTPFLARNIKSHPNGRLSVNLKTKEGKFKNVFVKTLMVDAFMGGKKPGVSYILRNGMQSDCSLNNIAMATPSQVGKKNGGALRRSIEKVDRDGNVVELYPSISEAAKQNYICRRSITMRCKNKVEDPYLLDGHTYRYEDRRRGGQHG